MYSYIYLRTLQRVVCFAQFIRKEFFFIEMESALIRIIYRLILKQIQTILYVNLFFGSLERIRKNIIKQS